MQGYNAVKLLAQNSPENSDHVTPVVEIVYVLGKGYHSVYWTEGLGFSDDTNGATTYSTHSTVSLMQRGRYLAESSENRMRVGVPGHSLFKQFVNVEFDHEKNQTVFSGFVVAVFDEMMRQLKQPYEFVSFNGSYDELMIQIPLKKFDAVAGDVAIRSSRLDYLDFTQPYTESGDKLHSNLSRIAVVMWLFVALIITQSYTASLASMLTAQRLEPKITSVEVLRDMNATVGYCNGSLVHHYLKDVLGFSSFKVKSYNSTHRYAEALYSGEIAAIFLEVPAAKVFLAQYCKSFIRTGETFKVGGYGFAFPRKYTLLSEVNKALTNVTESGMLKKLEDAYLTSEKCVDGESSPNEDESLSPRSFSILFELTGGTSTVALVVYIIMSFIEFKKSNPEPKNFFKLMSSFIKDQMRRSSSVVANAESS
ncbi:hypothetical protein L1987_31660 [Smallanthus sonchifolius]|uniref:Uncharacterized protein n=1 Tax=Smallanthus sonchifolius TaxID=185202 RepID=A0ACB9I7E6_9ASTR|nr:hypothetical protein L1987_31660 [Smallanthus sonchifolius]